jgi:hypothetical protein
MFSPRGLHITRFTNLVSVFVFFDGCLYFASNSYLNVAPIIDLFDIQLPDKTTQENC